MSELGVHGGEGKELDWPTRARGLAITKGGERVSYIGVKRPAISLCRPRALGAGWSYYYY